MAVRSWPLVQDIKSFLADLGVRVSLGTPGTVISVWLSTRGRCKTQNAAVNIKGAQKSNLKGCEYKIIQAGYEKQKSSFIHC